MHIPTMTMVVLDINEIILLINTVILLSRNGDESTNTYLRDKNAVIWLLLPVSVLDCCNQVGDASINNVMRVSWFPTSRCIIG